MKQAVVMDFCPGALVDAMGALLDATGTLAKDDSEESFWAQVGVGDQDINF